MVKDQLFKNKRFPDLQLAFRTGKVLGTFEEQASGQQLSRTGNTKGKVDQAANGKYRGIVKICHLPRKQIYGPK